MASDDDLLSLLTAHGQQFLDSFDLPAKTAAKKKQPAVVSNSDDEYEEWGGIHDSDDDNFGDELLDNNDDGFTADSRTAQPNVTVFSESRPANIPNKAAMKSFMSSKVSKLREDTQQDQKEAPTEEQEDEFNNAKNDALLHRLVHTKLLSGSLNPELNLTPAERRKALAGRVLELAGESKLGKGETSVRVAERNKAAKHVREGLVRKQHERETAQLEEAKQLGNYHPTLKKLYKGSASSTQHPRKRDRGLAMGIGKFSEAAREVDEAVGGGGGEGAVEEANKSSTLQGIYMSTISNT
ncbi:hypothetical protein EYR40_005362 [Pleurotus pulmonarius]|nr:hypothetical protein EYR40_005362 [Pleurotus pulmonarius]